jgi:hypothetical protein
MASINKQTRAADNYCKLTPWLMLLGDGKVLRFTSCEAAKRHAETMFPGCTFSRT